MEPVVAVLVGLAIVAGYLLAARACWRWATRRWPTARPGWLAVIAVCGAVYAPMWVPVWAVGRWMGLWPKPKDTGPPWRQGVPTIHISGMKPFTPTAEQKEAWDRLYSQTPAEILGVKPLEPSDVPLRKPRFYPFA